MKRLSISFLFLLGFLCTYAAEPFIVFNRTDAGFPVVDNGKPCPILVDSNEEKGILIAVETLREDFLRVSGTKAEAVNSPTDKTYISLLKFVRGVGSNSCGPDTRREFRFYTGRKKELSFTFRLMPLLK